MMLILVSCKEDFIEETSTYQIPIEMAIRDSEGLDEGVVGIYSALSGQQLNDIINFSELITDNGFLSNANNGQYSEIYNMTYNSNTGKIERLWNALNDVIIKSNWVLSYEGNVEYDEDIDGSEENFDKKVKNLFSEARILRAFARLQLANYFCERYGGDNQNLGVVINNKYSATDVYSEYPRSTVAETYDAIESDLLYAIENMTDDTVEVKDSRLNKLAAKVLMSRVSLYKRDWSTSIEYAEEAKDLADSIGINETPKSTPFTTSDNGNTSSIFQFVFDGNNSLSINSLYSYWGTNGNYKQFFATKEFYDLIISPTDGRRNIYTYLEYLYDTPKPYIAKKFGLSALFDIILIRRSEIEFNIIEATYYQDPIQARTLLNTWVQTNRDASYSSTSTGSGILDDILLQRRIEFAFEGYRFIDLKRNDLGWTKGANYKGTHGTVLITDKEQCLPIPQVEMTVNSKMVQNPGY